ncbi:MAG TPA: VWA domain-containing protein [Planctomycetota bacterium]|nr:VWA domain-containing protein [Planctomycetota bacterium]
MSLREYFAWPSLWPILLAAPLLWLLLAVTDRARARRLATVVGPRSAALAPGCQPQQRRLRRALTALGLLLALLAVLQPLLGAGARKFEQRGNDILVCLDVSRSMLARDLPPSRLLAARRELRALAERARGDRLGLLVFAGEARLSVPLTQDHDAFMAMVELADPLSVRRGGTDLGAALERALAALAGQDSDHQVVLLLSDGEDHEQRGRQIAERFRQQNIPVHCIGFGTPLGSKIAVAGSAGDETFLRDRSGAEVVSAMDADGLRALAEATGGVFVDASAQAQPLLRLYEQRIVPMARRAFAARSMGERENRFQWPLLAALLLWMLELCCERRR